MADNSRVRLVINGFGRIGRAAFKIALEHEHIEVVAINDLGDIQDLAYLLRFDSVYGRYGQSVAVREGRLVVGDTLVRVYQEREPAKLPWGDLKIDVVIESTGVFTDAEEARFHITAGARRVIISAPTESIEVPTVIAGVNEKALVGHDIVSNASCTTNCAAPVVAVLDQALGVEKALLTTVHAYTATQGLVDGPGGKSDARRGRAAAINIVPSSTGAAIAATKSYPALKDKFDGVALRVPVSVVSMADVTLVTKKKTDMETINGIFKEAAVSPIYGDILAVTDEPVVSSDFIGDPHSAIVDLSLTRVVGGDLVKVMAWYDNEWGYSNRLVEQAAALAQA
ncbi:MAG TPA: type I glyceraldehyde-3-phosphate dehydrogenase [Candidatus Andersenbacteria bacterium]|nr:type I glyceraldehyde-3-phosphate dehydrogenase [Candidatus Andersenbacteria bacterium]